MLLFNWVIFRFHVNFRGRLGFGSKKKNIWGTMLCLSFWSQDCAEHGKQPTFDFGPPSISELHKLYLLQAIVINNIYTYI